MMRLRPTPWAALPVIAMELTVATMVSPFIPDVITDFFEGSYSKTSLASGIADSIGAMVAFFLSAWLGAMSDQRGRKMYMMISVFGAITPCIVLAFYPYVNLWFYFGSKVVGKLTSWGLVLSYMADLTTKEQRSRAFGYMMGLIGLTICLGPLVVFVADTQWAFRASAMLGLVDLAYIYFVLPESLNSPEALAIKGATSLVDVACEDSSSTSDGAQSEVPPPPPLVRQESVNPLVTVRFFGQHKAFTALGLVVFFSQMSENGVVETSLLYLKDQLDFGPTQNVILLVGVGGCTMLVMFLLLPFLLKRVRETRLITVALLFDCCHVAMYTVASRAWQVYIIVIPASLGFMSYPSSSSLLSKWVDPSEQGIAMGALTGVKALTLGLGPLMFSGTFSLFTSDLLPFQFPQAAFLLGALFLLTAFTIAFFGLRSDDPLGVRRGSYVKIEDGEEHNSSEILEEQYTDSEVSQRRLSGHLQHPTVSGSD